MMISKVIVCPICKKKTFLRIQNGGYLDEYPIRVNCFNCRALMKGSFIMKSSNLNPGLHMLNAEIEECDIDTETITCRNADYVAEVSGELPCNIVKEYIGGIPLSPFLRSIDYIDSTEQQIERLKYFNCNMKEWKLKKSTAFQLLNDGSIDYIATALDNKMGDYHYRCDHYLKAIHCLQEVVHEETKDLFNDSKQDDYVKRIIREMSQVDKDGLHDIAVCIGGVQGLLIAYRKVVEVFSNFMNVYSNLLPAETFTKFKTKNNTDICISTCSFSDIKFFYQDAYEALLSLMFIPVCIDNIILRGDYQKFGSSYNKVCCPPNMNRDYKWYLGLNNGTRFNNLDDSEPIQKLINFKASVYLRNGIGHNNVQYDSITQEIKAFGFNNPTTVKYRGTLIGVAIECLGLARTAVIYSEIILYMMRREFKAQGVNTIIHPRFYKGVQLNDRCPCGSGLKYKTCCKKDIETIMRNSNV